MPSWRALTRGGSVKDRPALSMFLDAMEKGLIKEGKVVIDATSGNTGIALAMVGAALGVPVELAMPANVSEERKKIIKAYGAKVYLTDPLEGTDGAILFVRELVEKNPEKYVYLDQYNNPANWRAHFYSTGIELWHQTNGRITHLVAGIGTGGTIMGTGRRLKVFNPDIQIVGVQPAYPFHGIEGLKHIESSIKPGIFDESFLDRDHLCGDRARLRDDQKVGHAGSPLCGAILRCRSGGSVGTCQRTGGGCYCGDLPRWG
jgi:cysteine synthase B